LELQYFCPNSGTGKKGKFRYQKEEEKLFNPINFFSSLFLFIRFFLENRSKSLTALEAIIQIKIILM